MSKRKIGAKFSPITAKKARDWYQKKYLSTAGYLLVIKEILRPLGVDLKIDNVSKFCAEWGISRAAFYRALSTLNQNGNCPPEWSTLTQNRIETEIRDRLHQKLGGLKEVATPAGRIDLLTDTEIIEIKRVSDWKAALFWFVQ